MTLNIELSDEIAAAVKMKAHAQGLSPDRYVSQVLANALTSEVEQGKAEQPFETGYGMWANYGPAPSAEEIDENRREMFQNFAQDS